MWWPRDPADQEHAVSGRRRADPPQAAGGHGARAAERADAGCHERRGRRGSPGRAAGPARTRVTGWRRRAALGARRGRGGALRAYGGIRPIHRQRGRSAFVKHGQPGFSTLSTGACVRLEREPRGERLPTGRLRLVGSASRATSRIDGIKTDLYTSPPSVSPPRSVSAAGSWASGGQGGRSSLTMRLLGSDPGSA